MKRILKTAAAVSVALGILLATACSTVNNLAYYDLTDSYIALDMTDPPEPSFIVGYSGNYDPNNQFVNIVQLGVNLIKAGEAEIAREKMGEALRYVDIPGMISESLLDDIADTLDARAVRHKRDADVLLEVDILEYGIEATSGSGNVEMFMKLNACLFHRSENEIVWQRRVSVSEEITPGLFGFNEVLGSAATIAGLNSLSEEELAEGFERMAREITRETVRKLQKDLREAWRE